MLSVADQRRATLVLATAVASFRKAEAAVREEVSSVDRLRQHLQAMQQQQMDVQGLLTSMRHDISTRLAALEAHVVRPGAPCETEVASTATMAATAPPPPPDSRRVYSDSELSA